MYAGDGVGDEAWASAKRVGTFFLIKGKNGRGERKRERQATHLLGRPNETWLETH